LLNDTPILYERKKYDIEKTETMKAGKGAHWYNVVITSLPPPPG